MGVPGRQKDEWDGLGPVDLLEGLELKLPSPAADV
jgi:hypothetical protein